jgi:hypothetical protein
MSGSWIVLVTVFSTLLVESLTGSCRRRKIVGTAWGERWVMVVSMDRVVVLEDGIEVVRRFGMSIRFKGCGRSVSYVARWLVLRKGTRLE